MQQERIKVPEPYWSKLVSFYELTQSEATHVGLLWSLEQTADKTKEGWWRDMYDEANLLAPLMNEDASYRVGIALGVLKACIAEKDTSLLDGEPE